MASTPLEGLFPRFSDPALEAEYLETRRRRYSAGRTRLGYILAGASWIATGLVASLAVGEPAVWWLMTGANVPLTAAGAVLAHLRGDARRLPAWVLNGSALVPGLTLVVGQALFAGRFDLVFGIAIAVYIVAVHTFMGLTSRVANAITLALVVSYAAVVFLLSPTAREAATIGTWGAVVAHLGGLFVSRSEERYRRRDFHQARLLDEERERSERLLRNILPAPIAERLKRRADRGALADGFDSATVLFADLVGFTAMSARMPATELVALLDRVFTELDALTERHGLEKIKTIGDAYMVVGGVPTPRPDHAAAVAEMAFDLLAAVARLEGPVPLRMRVGIHTGPVVAGIIGRQKYIYDLWGDSVNTASRMESHGEAGRIHVSQETRDALADRYELRERGLVDVKGKGPLRTYWLVDRKGPAEC